MNHPGCVSRSPSTRQARVIPVSMELIENRRITPPSLRRLSQKTKKEKKPLSSSSLYAVFLKALGSRSSPVAKVCRIKAPVMFTVFKADRPYGSEINDLYIHFSKANISFANISTGRQLAVLVPEGWSPSKRKSVSL